MMTDDGCNDNDDDVVGDDCDDNDDLSFSTWSQVWSMVVVMMMMMVMVFLMMIVVALLMSTINWE